MTRHLGPGMLKRIFVCAGLAVFLLVAARFSFAQSAGEWLGRGDASFEEGDYADALVCYTRAVEIDGKNPGALKRRAAAYGRLERYDEAIADFTRVIEISPNDAAAYYGRGINYYALGRNDRALPDFKAACELGDKLGCKIERIVRSR
jgi:tetratricopeptide (TPR) repeat protein